MAKSEEGRKGGKGARKKKKELATEESGAREEAKDEEGKNEWKGGKRERRGGI